MLEIRLARNAFGPVMRPTGPEAVVVGLREDTDYLIDWPGRLPGARLYVDDVEIVPGADGSYRWRPCFYAGRALAELLDLDGAGRACWLDVGPAESKS